MSASHSGQQRILDQTLIHRQTKFFKNKHVDLFYLTYEQKIIKKIYVFLFHRHCSTAHIRVVSTSTIVGTYVRTRTAFKCTAPYCPCIPYNNQGCIANAGTEYTMGLA